MRKETIIIGNNKEGKGYILSFNNATKSLKILEELEDEFSFTGSSAMTVKEGYIMVCGGYQMKKSKRRVSKKAVRDCFAFNTLSYTCTRLPPLKQARYDMALVNIKDRVFAIGGKTGCSNKSSLDMSEEFDNHARTCEVFDKLQSEWKTIAEPNVQAYKNGCFVYNGHVWVTGWTYDDEKEQIRMERYLESKSQWEDVDLCLKKRFYFNEREFADCQLQILTTNESNIIVVLECENVGAKIICHINKIDLLNKEIVSKQTISQTVFNKSFMILNDSPFFEAIYEDKKDSFSYKRLRCINEKTKKTKLNNGQWNGFCLKSLQAVPKHRDVRRDPYLFNLYKNRNHSSKNILFGINGGGFQLEIDFFTGAIEIQPTPINLILDSFFKVCRVNGLEVFFFSSRSDPILYNLETREQSYYPRLEIEDEDYKLIALNGLIYIIDGFETKTSRLDLKKGLWERIAYFSTPRLKSLIFKYKNTIYAAGGLSQSGICNTIEAYDEKKDQWATLHYKLDTCWNDLTLLNIGEKMVYFNKEKTGLFGYKEQYLTQSFCLDDPRGNHRIDIKQGYKHLQKEGNCHIITQKGVFLVEKGEDKPIVSFHAVKGFSRTKKSVLGFRRGSINISTIKKRLEKVFDSGDEILFVLSNTQ